MAEDEDRDGPASPRRLEHARQAGQVPLSREIVTVAVLGMAATMISLNGTSMGRHLVIGLRPFLEQGYLLDPVAAMRAAATVGLGLMAPVVLMALAAGVGAVMLQTGFLFHTRALIPDFSRISPGRGFARLLGAATLKETGKALLKLGVVGWASWVAVAQLWPLVAATGSVLSLIHI